jgi:hypothetical protein
MNGTLFVANQDMAQFVLFENFVINGENGPARITKDDFDTLIDEGTNDYARAGHGFLCRHRSYSISPRTAWTPPDLY